jgi:hypothetical protein
MPASTLTPHVLALLLQLPPMSGDLPESDEHRTWRLWQQAAAIDHASQLRPGGWDPVQVAGVLVTLGTLESRFSYYVTSNQCDRGPVGARCDKGRARFAWQLWRRACPRAWAYPDNSYAATQAAAVCASRLFVGGHTVCRRHPAGRLAGAFSAYGRGSCHWSGAARRVPVLMRLTSQLRGRVG